MFRRVFKGDQPRRARVAAVVVAALLAGGLVPVVTAAPALAAPFDCTPGVVYTQERTTGQAYVTRVDAATGATQRWSTTGFAENDTNGLALSASATTSYAVDQSQSGSMTSIYALSSEGVRSTIAGSVTVSGVDASNLVGGALDPNNGFYYFGGYSIQSVSGTNRAFFELHAYDVASNVSIGRVGRVLIPESTPTSQNNQTGNGDIAFDAQGNLYLIWSFTGGAVNKLVRVSAAAIPSTAGSTTLPGTLLSSPAASTNDLAYNGMTFDGNGVLYLQNARTGGAGNVTQIAAYDPNTGAPAAAAVTVALDGYGVDLASCSYPPTLQLKKDVGGRLPATDQFGLAIHRTDTTGALATATTAGTATGVQDQIAGPVIALPGRTYRIEETAAAGADLADYATTYECRWGSETAAFASGTATGSPRSATLPVIPANRSGQQLTCTFANTPLAAAVTVTKQVQDSFGQNQRAASGWTVGAAAAATAGAVTTTPSQATQTTDANGAADWMLRFAATTGRATVTVSETQQPDYQFVSGSCTITSTSGASRTVTLPSAAATPIAGIAPGDVVACQYVNRLRPTFLTLVKHVESPYGGAAAASAWTLTATGPTAEVTGTTGSAAVTHRQVAAGDYALSESGGPAGYGLTQLACEDATTGETVAGVSTANPSLTLAPGQDVTCTYTNTEQPAHLTLVKVVDNGTTGGTAVASDWTLTATPVQIAGQDPVSGPGGSAAVTARQVFSGRYDLSEAGERIGYAAGTWSCTGGTVSGARVTVPSGADVTCTITNTAVPPRLTLVKTVTNDDGGQAEPADWTLTADGPTPISGATGTSAVTGATVQAGVYTLGEADGPGGYQAGAWTCVGATAIGGAVTVPVGGDVTCTIDNDDIAPSLTLVKIVDNGDTGATAVPADWTLSASGPVSIEGASGADAVTDAVVRIGTYALAEAGGPVGYDLASLSCVDDTTGEQRAGTTADARSVTLAVGDAVTCTFENVAVDPEWSFFKTSDPPSGATVAPGTVITYTLTAVRGTGVPARDVVLTDDLSSVLEDAELVGEIVPTLGSAEIGGTALVWTIPSLTQTSTLTYRVRVHDDALGATIDNVVTAEGSIPPGPCPEAEPACRETEHLTPQWTFAKTSDPASGSAVDPGDVITYTLTATNTGPVPVSGAVATDDLSGVLTQAALTGALPHGVTVSGTTLTWTLPEIPVDGSASVSYAVRVHDDAVGPVLRNAVTATGPVPPDDCADEPCTTEHIVTRLSSSDGGLALTGGTVAWTAGVLGGLLLLGGLPMLLIRRRREVRGEERTA